MSSSATAALFLSQPPHSSAKSPSLTTTPPQHLHLRLHHTFFPLTLSRFHNTNPFRVHVDDGDADDAGGGDDLYEMDEEEVEEVDNKKDYDVEYEPLAHGAGGDDEEIAMVESKSFVLTKGWESEKVVDYRINEDEFHKISLLDCDFFIRKPPDPDNDVYDFREVIEVRSLIRKKASL